MDNKIIISSVVALAASVGVAVTQIDFKTKVPGPADNDKCVSQLVALAKDNAIDCLVANVHVSKWSPAHPTDDAALTPMWICNGGVPSNQDCLSLIAGGHDIGTTIHFAGVEGADGIVRFKAETRAPPPK